MSYSQDVMEELHTLKSEAGDMLRMSAQEWQKVSREKAHVLTADLKTFLTDLRDTLALEEADVERAFAGRTVPAIATALTIGIAIGYFLRRKS